MTILIEGYDDNYWNINMAWEPNQDITYPIGILNKLADPKFYKSKITLDYIYF